MGNAETKEESPISPERLESEYEGNPKKYLPPDLAKALLESVIDYKADEGERLDILKMYPNLFLRAFSLEFVRTFAESEDEDPFYEEAKDVLLQGGTKENPSWKSSVFERESGLLGSLDTLIDDDWMRLLKRNARRELLPLLGRNQLADTFFEWCANPMPDIELERFHEAFRRSGEAALSEIEFLGFLVAVATKQETLASKFLTSKIFDEAFPKDKKKDRLVLALLSTAKMGLSQTFADLRAKEFGNELYQARNVLAYAAISNSVDIAKQIIEDKRFRNFFYRDPTDEAEYIDRLKAENLAIRRATKEGNWDVLHYLLEAPQLKNDEERAKYAYHRSVPLVALGEAVENKKNTLLPEILRIIRPTELDSKNIESYKYNLQRLNLNGWTKEELQEMSNVIKEQAKLVRLGIENVKQTLTDIEKAIEEGDEPGQSLSWSIREQLEDDDFRERSRLKSLESLRLKLLLTVRDINEAIKRPRGRQFR